MSLFVDASAIVAMLAKEPDALDIADRLDDSDHLLWSAIVQWETIAALTRIRAYDPFAARSEIHEFGQAWQFKLATIGEWEAKLAFEAFRLYGKGSSHPAKLNMGDCFAYACAKANQAELLYKGDCFSNTDLA